MRHPVLPMAIAATLLLVGCASPASQPPAGAALPRPTTTAAEQCTRDVTAALADIWQASVSPAQVTAAQNAAFESFMRTYSGSAAMDVFTRLKSPGAALIVQDVAQGASPAAAVRNAIDNASPEVATQCAQISS